MQTVIHALCRLNADGLAGPLKLLEIEYIAVPLPD